MSSTEAAASGATKSRPIRRGSTSPRFTPTSRVRTGRPAFRSRSSNARCAHSLCFGLYESRSGAQVGLARVVTDHATFAYLCDVYVLEEHRGRGLGKLMMREVMAHPALTGARRVMLGTRDAHGLYAQFGFRAPPGEGVLMQILRPDIYRRAESRHLISGRTVYCGA